MIKSDWHIFSAKFSENPQDNFEWFCYLLFCKEYGKQLGVSGYFNQRNIETKPIIKESDVIAWQAKFYESPTMAGHKPEIIKLISGAKKDYPNITKIIFYTNVNWSQGKRQNDTKEKLEIDKVAEGLGIKIDWDHMQNFFKSSFVSIDNELIAKYFFNLDKSIFDLVEELKDHSINILKEINTSIKYDSKEIEIDRSSVIDKIEKDTSKVLILSGSGGVGKTAIIKKYYEKLNNKISLYIFKATEFEISNINNLFNGFSLQDFINVHREESEKIIVIDSAERLIDITNTNPIREFLSNLVDEKWKIIFTTRDSYLDDLTYQFLEIYNVIPTKIIIQNIETSELKELSKKYSFLYPKDEKVVRLLQSPFYLNEYLRFCKKDEEINYSEFKQRLWNKIIKKSKPSREQCFLKIAFTRANSGQYFIIPESSSQILFDELTTDGVLGYEIQGYFITHDIYEEWALEKCIENEFKKKTNNNSFFVNIGDGLSIRRSIRSWISEKLLLDNQEIKTFIEETVADEGIESFWKDEILVSVLLSDYSKHFFDIFKLQLLSKNYELLKKLTFLLRIACKEVDGETFNKLGIEDVNLFSLRYILTKPKGYGWKSLIKFIYENIDKIGIENIYFILPVIFDWNKNNKKGETTKLASLIALQYYQWLIKEEVYFSNDGTKEKLFETIIYGSYEVSNELKEIITQIVSNKWKNHSDPYYDLSKYILTKLEAIDILKVLPENVLQLANLFWTYTPKESDYYPYQGEIEHRFGIEDSYSEYFPHSSYQTPIHWLLQFSLKETVDFILEFTNKCVEYFANTTKNEVEEIEIFLNEKDKVKQYINSGLWCAYRGTQNLPSVLESTHMALEKFFLKNGKEIESKILESWLIYLIKNSKSASITSVVVSVVLAYPDKTFNVAKILFKTKELFLYDTTRLVLDQGQKSNLLMLKEFGSDWKNKYHQDERLKACDEKHRTWSLENIFLNFQIIRTKETSEDESKARQISLWEILDNYYNKLPETSKETNADKTWRLYLARMDRRKMKPTTEKKDGNIIIKFNTEIDPVLKKFSEAPLKKSNYISLKLWAYYRIKNSEECKQYAQYEEHSENALKDVKKVIITIKKNKDKEFILLNYSVPVDVCSVLFRDFCKVLSKEDKKFCKKIIFEYARQFLKANYKYQITDGTESAFSVLPDLLKAFPKDKEIIKIILLFGLFNDYPINMVGSGFNAFSINAIHKMWTDNYEDAQSIFFGYLILKPKYEALREKIRADEFKKGNYQFGESFVIEQFNKENAVELQKIITNQNLSDEIKNIEQQDLAILRTAFLLVPLKTTDETHKKIVKEIINASIKKLLSSDREDRIAYDVRHNFFEKISYFILSSKKENVEEFLKPIIDNFNNSENMSDLLKEFISAEDRLYSYENFWLIWELFYKKVVEISKKGDRYWYTDEIIKSYLFAKNVWKDTATSWDTLKDNNASFFKKITIDMANNPSVLYSISKLLNNVGSIYSEKGIDWIYSIVSNNKKLKLDKLETDTVYYIENILKKYIYLNREKVVKAKELKNKVLVILEFLIEKGSVIGYILRENIL